MIYFPEMRVAAFATFFICCMGSPAIATITHHNAEHILTQWDHDEHPDLRGVVILRRGKLVAERYFNGETVATLHDVRSAGKSITALLVGTAIDRGKIRTVDDSVEQYWPDARGHAIGDVSIGNVLTMRSGLDAFDENPDSPGNEDKFDESADPLAFVLSVPRATAPGTLYRYNSVTAYVAGILVEKAVGQRMSDYARGRLFNPLGISRWTWASDAAGHTKGQGNLALSARDFAKVGELVLGMGVYKGKRIVSAAWIEECLRPRLPISAFDPYADGYGYFWYSKTQQISGNAIPISFASGNGGNKIYVVPDRQMVIAITSSAYGHGYGQRRSQAILQAILAEDLRE